MEGYQCGEVVDDQSGENFVKDALHLFCMNKLQPNILFEMTERGFNSPPFRIEFFHSIRWEIISRKIGNDCFKAIGSDLESNYSKIHLKGGNISSTFRGFRKEVKDCIACKGLVVWNSEGFLCAGTTKDERNRNIIFPGIRQRKVCSQSTGSSIFDTNQEVPALNDTMGKGIECFVPPISNDNGLFYVGAVYQIVESGTFVKDLTAFHDCVHISVGAKVVQSVDVQKVKVLFAINGGKIGILIRRIWGRTERGTVNSKQTIALEGLVGDIRFGKRMEQFYKGRFGQFVSLLNKGGHCGKRGLAGEKL